MKDEHAIGVLILIGLGLILLFALIYINMNYVHELDMYKLTNNCKVEVEK